MLCERCGQRPATVHMTEITNGQKNETHLCEVCAREMQHQGISFVVPPIQLHNFLAGLLNNSLTEGNKQQQAESTGRICEKCGVTEEQIANQGLLGCGDCYPFFADRVQPLLRKIHGRTRHIGKVPARTGGKARVAKEIDELKGRLKTAVRQEDFEQAALLRDRIHLLENSLREGEEADVAEKDS